MRFVAGLLILAACGGAAQAPPKAQPAPQPVAVPQPQPAPVEPTPADPRIAADLKSFDLVWQRVADLFYDPSYGGVDWKAVRAELPPEIEALPKK